MIAGLPSLTGLLRRSKGSSGADDPLNGEDASLSSGETLLKRKRLKVAILAIVFGLVSAVIELPLPAEDAFRLAKSELRQRNAPQDIVMVAIDDKTLNELGMPFPTRKEESLLIGGGGL
jgi:CHASE2 domain-containing sensor protein